MDAQTSSELESIKKIILNTVETEAIYLFGSYAHGTPREDSDFDLYIVIPDDSIRPLEAAQNINIAIFRGQKKPVDILVARAGDFHRRKQLPTIERTVAREGVMLYG